MEKLLPAKPKVDIPSGEHVEEVSMMEYENTKGSTSKGYGAGSSAEAYMEGSDDEEGGQQRVECNTH